jgi:membrane-associated phospholipid phosphatase
MRFFNTSVALRMLLVLAALGFWFPACKNIDPVEEPVVSKALSEYDHEVAFKWTELFLDVERYAAGYRPGSAPRAWAHMGLAAYEGCIQGMPGFNSMAPLYASLNIPQPEKNAVYHYPTVVNATYSYLMPRFFSKATNKQNDDMNNLQNYFNNKYRSEAGDEVFERSKKYGEAVAAAVWEWSLSDKIATGNVNDVYLDPFAGYDWESKYKKNGDWRPTFPGPGKGMYALWGQVRTFALKESQKLCRPPLPYSENPVSDYYSQAIEVYAQNTPTQSYEDEWVGEFWSDDLVGLTFSPGPRWLAIGNQVLVNENSNLETAVYMHAKVGMAVTDANIGAWYSKYYYNLERPQTFINRFIDPDWKPSLENPLTGDKGLTPSFPAYPSGHATMSGAGAEALASIFGYSYAMTDNCHKDRAEFSGTPRTFTSFLEMAQENAWSRVPLGVHWRMDSEEGVRFGTEIARNVNKLPWKK